MRLLLAGKSGQLGFELQRALTPIGEVVAVSSKDCDFTDPDAIRVLIQTIRPDVIVNAVAYTAVDRAESEPDIATAVNAKALQVIGEEAEKLGALVVHYSTDYVFDGSKAGAYVESDPTSPQSVYGKSKRDGEVALMQATSRHLVLRTSWLVGAHGQNFAKTILRLSAERDNLNVVADQWGVPTSAALLADLTAHAIRPWHRNAEHEFPYGLYHVAASGETNWCEYARYVVSKARAADLPIKLHPDNIRAITTAEYPASAARPANSRLDTRRFRETFGLHLPHWQANLDHVLEQLFDKK